MRPLLSPKTWSIHFRSHLPHAVLLEQRRIALNPWQWSQTPEPSRTRLQPPQRAVKRITQSGMGAGQRVQNFRYQITCGIFPELITRTVVPKPLSTCNSHAIPGVPPRSARWVQMSARWHPFYASGLLLHISIRAAQSSMDR